MKIAVIDGQGGGIGKYVIRRLREELGDVDLLALGTNAVAAANMLRAGANDAACGENAVSVCVEQVDIIIGSLSIIVANSMLGEVTPKMTEAIGRCRARKILLPLSREQIEIVGVSSEPLPHYVDMIIERLTGDGEG